MSRAAFLSLPAQGHINPTLALVAELVRRGHEVDYYATEEFRSRIEDTGAAYRGYPAIGYDFKHPDRNLVKLAAAFANISADVLPAILGSLEETKPDLLIHDSMAPWGAYAARILGLPAVCSTSTFAFDPAIARGLVSTPSAAIRTALTSLGGVSKMRAASGRLRSDFGIDVSVREIFSNRGDLTLVYTSRMLQPNAERFDESVHFIGPSLPPVLPCDDPLLAELDAARDKGTPLVYVSLGTVFNHRVDFYRACIDAFAGTDMQLLIASGSQTDVASFGELPDNVRVRPFVPQLQVLSRASLFLTHGGANSVNEGLYFGVPLLLYPQMDEQALVSRRVESLGAGRVLKRSSANPKALRRAIRDLLADSETRRKAFAIGESLAKAGGYLRAADLVERLARRQANTAASAGTH